MIAALKNIPVKITRLAASRLVQNVSALALVQAIGYLVPLVTLPYLTRVLGPEEWGRVAWMQVILSYFTVVTNWGFSWSGVRKVSTLRNDRAALSKSFFASWAVQWMLCAVALGALCGLSLYASFFAPFRSYAFFGAGIIVSGVLFPLWLLTGLERMRELAVVQLIIRAGAVPLIFLFVRVPGDGPLVIAASALTGIVGGLSALLWVRRNLSLEWYWPRWRTIGEEFLESGAIFFSRVWIVLYTSLTPTVLGAMAGAVAVGYYVLADKICSGARSLLAPVSQALFPRMSYLFAHDREGAVRLLWRSGKWMVLLSAGTSLALALFADPIVLLIAGKKFGDAGTVLSWLSPLPLVIMLSNIFGLQIMLPNHMTQAFNRILGTAGILSLLMMTFWISWRGAVGAAINTLTAECFVTVAMALYLARCLRRETK